MSGACTVAHLQHKLELVEASRRRYQKAAAGPQSGDSGLQLTAEELRAAEDALAQLQVEHQEALQRTEDELRSLRDRCAVLEAEQQADIDACATCSSITDSPATRKAFLAGKAEGQRETISAHAKIESLTRALEDSEKTAVSANIQLMELKGKYHQTLQDKVKLQRQLRTLQDKLHEIHLQQVETLSSVITNTTRADQMNRRVWESLDKALNTKQAAAKSPPAEIAMLTAENTMLRKALLSSLQQEDTHPAHMTYSSSRMRGQGSSGGLDSSLDVHNDDQWTSRSASPVQQMSPEHAEGLAEVHETNPAAKAETTVISLNTKGTAAMEPRTPPKTAPAEVQQAAPPVADDASPVAAAALPRTMARSVSFSKDTMFDTLKAVLTSKGVHIPQPHTNFSEDLSKQSSSSASSGSDTSESESSSWSGDELIATHAAAFRSRRASTASQVQSLSGMLRTPSEGDSERGSYEQESGNDASENSGQEAQDGDQEDTGFSRSSIRAVKRHDSVELSKERLSPGFKAPAIALGACAYIKKLALAGKRVQADESKVSVVPTKESGDESRTHPEQKSQSPMATESVRGARKLMPGRLWVALKDKGSGNTASGVAAALDGFEDQDDESPGPVQSEPQPVDSSAIAGSPPRNQPQTELGPQPARQSMPPTSNKAGLSLSGHVSPVQSLSSTESGQPGSRVPSPGPARSPSPAGLPYDRFSERAQLPQKSAHTTESLLRFQDSRIAELEEQAAYISSYAATAPQQAVPARTMWEQRVWEGPMDYPGAQCAHHALLQTPLLAASQEHALPSGMVLTSAGALTGPGNRWKPGSAVGVHGCSSRAKQAGMQYANALMRSYPGYRLPRQVPQVVQLPSAGYALHD